MPKLIVCIFLFISFLHASCVKTPKEQNKLVCTQVQMKDTVIVDCQYTFAEAMRGSNAPSEILKQLELINVQYLSVDNLTHRGQIIVNKRIAADVQYLFDFMLSQRFPIAKVIPIVAYKWDDKASMQDNNSYSFCYRNVDFSKHATGMAIDINPFFNPLRWKTGVENRIDRPIGAIRDTTVAGTFYATHPVVLEFKKRGFRWGHYFKRNYDDHHFQKK